MGKTKNLKIFTIIFLIAVMLTSCVSERHRRKKKCMECPSFSYILINYNERA